jgi:histidinol-phosphate aminotransferase
MLIEPRSEVLNLPPAVHGTPDPGELLRLGLRPAEVLDFSVNTNPYDVSPSAREAVARTPLDCYPDREALTLRAALAEHLGVSPRRILAGNGSSELIWLVALAFLRPGDRALVLGPTYSEYARAAALLGARVTTYPAPEAQQFTLDSAEVSRQTRYLRPRLVFLCNPNNPTGTVVEAEVVTDWASEYPDTLFLVDEAYLSFAHGLRSTLQTARDNVLVLRSMTKDFALAGLRLGYAVGCENLITLLARVRPPWNVNAPAQAAGVAALRDREYLARSLERLAQAKSELVASLLALGWTVLPSAVHFFLVRVPDGAAFRLSLLRRGILVRDCTSFGLSGYVRICTRRPEDNARLLSALREV